MSPALATWGPGLAYSRMLRFESGPDIGLPSLAVECDLCESWTMEDQTTFEFELRDGVRWQNIPPVNGRELTANDIVFSYNRQRQTDLPNSALLAAVSDVEAPQPDRVRISLLVPDADFTVSLADGHSKIVAPEAVELNGDLRNGPTIGTGPWVLVETRPNQSHLFESNPTYFEEGLPFAESLLVQILPDGPTRDAAFKVGAIDVNQMAPMEWREFHERRPEAPFVMFMEVGVGLEVAMKTSAPPFDEVDLRRAAFYAMDPWQAINDIWLGSAYVSLGFPPAGPEWMLPVPQLKAYFDRPELARDLLMQASDAPVPISIKVGDFGEAYMAHAQLIAYEMEAVGFAPTLDLVNRRVFGEHVWLGGEYQMFVGPTSPVTSPNGYLVPVLHSMGRWNTAEFRDAELDILIEAQAQEYDREKRKRLVHRIQRLLLQKAYRFMPATSVSIWAWWPRVQNLHPNFVGFEYSYWSRVWLDD